MDDVKYCPDLNCVFHTLCPNGKNISQDSCPCCQSPFIAQKQSIEDPDQSIEDAPCSTGSSVEPDGDLLIVSDHTIMPSMSPSHSGPPTDEVIVTFFAAIQRSHIINHKYAMSLQFHYSPLVELKLELLEFKSHEDRRYDGTTYTLLTNSVKIPSKILDIVGRGKSIIIPYTYYIGNQKETHYSNKAICFRSLVVNHSNFYAPNVINKYDTIILPPGLFTREEQRDRKDLKKLMGLSFNLFIPELQLSQEGELFPSFAIIKDELQTVLRSLCESRVITVRKPIFSKREYITSYLYNTKEERDEVRRDLLMSWIIALVHSDLPFHLKFYLSFLCPAEALMKPYAGEIFCILFENMTSEYMLYVIQTEEEISLFRRYQTEMRASPQLLHCAMQIVSGLETDSFMVFLPLYHLLFDSEQDFEQAHSTHSFLDDAYWGLPDGIQFKHNPKIELSKVTEVLTQFNTTFPILPYSIILLYFRADMFSQLLRILAIPFLPFFSVLLYRMDKWSLLSEDTTLRESVFNAFLAQIEQTPNLMNHGHISQASDALFLMIQSIEEKQDTHSISVEEACLLLRVLGRLLCVYNVDNNSFSEQKLHLAKNKILFLVPSSVLITSIENCVKAGVMLNRHTNCDEKCFQQVIVWNRLYCTRFPPSYSWVDSLSKEFSKQLECHSLACLLSSINKLLEASEKEISLSTCHDICLGLILIAEKSQNPLRDHEIIIKSLDNVPGIKFKVIIDVLAKIIVLHRLDIMEGDAVEHILSVYWYPLLFRRCSTHMLKCSRFPEAEALLSSCIEAIHKLHTNFYNLNITVKDLLLVIQYRMTFFELLKSLPFKGKTGYRVMNESNFDSVVKQREDILNYYLNQHRLIRDLKRMLDSTESGVNSTEVSEFLSIEYESESISSLCTVSRESEFVLMPRNTEFNSFNKSPIKAMLDTMPLLLQSQLFKSRFKQGIILYLETDKSEVAINVGTIYMDHWLTSLQFVSVVLLSLFNMNIPLNTITQHFGVYRHHPQEINVEIRNLVLVLQNFGYTYDQALINQSLDKVIDYFRLKTIENLVKLILQIRDAYRFQRSFSTIESISNLELNNADNKLSIISPELLSSTDILSDLTQLHFDILQTLLECVALFTWTAGVLQNSADLDSFTDLALNTADTTFNVTRITSFNAVCSAFMPFILELEEVDENIFLKKLRFVHKNLQESNKAHELLVMSRDCAKKNELEFWKEFKQSHTSIGGSIIYPLKHIMRNGMFILSTGANTRSIDDILKLQFCFDASQMDQVYSLEALREMQSNIILITPILHEDEDTVECVAILEQVIILADLFLQMHTSGNIFFRKLTYHYKCQSIDKVKLDISFLREECKKWNAQLAKARDECYQLNFFTALQIGNIQVGLEGMANGRDLDRDTFHLLTLIREHISQQDIETAFYRFRSGSLSSQSLDSSINSSVNSVDTLSSIAFSDSGNLNSTPSQDSHSGVCEVSLKDMYIASKRDICFLNNVAAFIKYLYRKNETQKEMPSALYDTEPNLICVERSVLLTHVLSFYLQTGFQAAFPSQHEVLICSEDTTTEDIDIFWRRALNSPSSCEIFCLAFIENLIYEVAMQSVASLKNQLQLKREGNKLRLVLLCSIGSEESSYMANALAQYKRIHAQSVDTATLKELVFQLISNIQNVTNESPYLPLQPSSIIDPDTSCVRIVNSECAGSGKSLTVSRLVNQLKERADVPTDMCTTINLFESHRCEHRAACKLIDFPRYVSPYGRICHLDITATCYEELIPFLFKLLITGIICDEDGRIWRCSKRNYYVIEVTLSSQSPELLNFLPLFPDWQCLDPRAALKYLKTQKELPIGTHITDFDRQEMNSTKYLRVFSCLTNSTSKRRSQIIETNNHQTNIPVELLDVLLKNCSIRNPSWNVLKHFTFFLNNQLEACEKNIYCNQMVSVDSSWKGLKEFLIDFMVLMSRDFTTPSLKNCLERPSTSVILGYSIEVRRKWEQKNHPLLFLNEDGHTMTFFGIYVSDSLDQLDAFNENRIIMKKVFPMELYNTLRLNRADMEQDCSTWDRSKMISILSNVMNNSLTPWTDADPCYVLTIDNMKKMLAIHMRFRCNIPVIIMGETGCGKTRLIDFMCKLHAMRRNIENLVVLRVHGETTRQDIIISYEKALELSRENIRHGVDTVLFFDETNTSPMIGLIKEILCDRRIDGSPIPTDCRLQFIAACNPYREHTPDMKRKLATAGLGMITGDNLPREHFGDIPLRDLVYRVIPLPQSLLPLVWDFGQLNNETENAYITEITRTYFTRETLENLISFCSVISKVLSAVQLFMRERKDECSFVSLRDVERAVRVMLWFYKIIPKLETDPSPTISLVTYSLILSLAVCYRAKLKDRTAFDACLIACLESPLSPITDALIISRAIESFQTCIVNLMTIPNHIARNAALKENLFMMYVCIQLKIPLFIIGKPGSSKSLARSIINHSINEGILVEGKKIAEYTHVYMQCYQCSQYTTSKEILGVFDKCRTIQKESAADSVACVVLDEVGLAEDSPNLPLKVLHSLLESYTEFVRSRPNVAFVGLSNWALDPAKMNRSIMVQLGDPSIEDIIDTAHAIIKPSGQVDDRISERLTPYVRSIAEGYLKLCLSQNDLLSRDYFGLRDLYSLMKMLYCLCKRYNSRLNRSIMIHALRRNFGGITGINVLEIFHRCLIGLDDDGIGPLSDPLSLISASLEPLGYESALERSRYFLLLTENYVAIDILFQSKIINTDTKVMFGTQYFPRSLT